MICKRVSNGGEMLKMILLNSQCAEVLVGEGRVRYGKVRRPYTVGETAKGGDGMPTWTCCLDRSRQAG